MTYFKNKKILLTGGAGFLGQYVEKELIRAGTLKKNILIPRSKDLDLKESANVKKAVNNKDIIIHLAAVVGGIEYNRKNPGKMIYDNLIIGLNIFEQARKAKVKKIITMGSVCAYPKFTPVPFKEEDLWNGYPEETNAPYGLAKKMLLEVGKAYKQQYSLNSIFLLMVNLYGPGDNFDPKSSHVIPALIRRIHEAKKQNKKAITVWGTGKASREFLYVEDAAKAIVLAGQKYNKPDAINIGAGFEITIKELVLLIAKLMKYKGKIIWDKSKPDGQPRRCLDTTKAEKLFGFKAKTDFKTGLKKTIKWYERNHS
jgi:GDP-L-fucose synthase